jgi:hypothetical protein
MDTFNVFLQFCIIEMSKSPKRFKAGTGIGFPKDIRERLNLVNLPEHRQFQKGVSKLLGHFKDAKEEQLKRSDSEPLREECFIEDDDKAEEESPIHQQLLQKYMNFKTPYRGVLLYHSLGSGKTASSIGIIEAMKTTGKVYILTPAALEVNYRFEINKHAIRIFGQPYTWSFKTLSDVLREETSRGGGVKSRSEILQSIESSTGIPREMIIENDGLFIQEPSAPTGKGMTTQEIREKAPLDLKKLEKQLIQSLLRQITFIRYNGVKAETLQKMDFEKATIVIDEVHNVISMIRNNGLLKNVLLDKLMNYNTRIIALSGTPIINHPFEVAILMRILRGTIPMYECSIQGSAEKSDETIEREALHDPWVRWAGIDRSKGQRLLLIEPNPIGFLSWFEAEESPHADLMGLYYTNDYQAIDDARLEGFQKEMKRRFDITLGSVRKSSKKYEWLPTSEKDFVEHYLQKTPDGLMYRIFNRETLARRFLGMISYYQVPSSASAYPKSPPEEILKIPMSETQFGIYINDRRGEIQRELQYKKRSSQKENPLSNPPSEYKSTTRHTCNGIFPVGEARPGDERRQGRRKHKSKQEIEADVQLKMNELMKKMRTLDTYKMTFVRESQGGSLKEHCPKMEELLSRMDGGDPRNAKMSLIYSQFERMEGLELIRLVLDMNGYYPVELIRQDGQIRLRIPTAETHPDLDMDSYRLAPKYILFTGAVDRDIREANILMYRGDFEKLGEGLQEDIKSLYGEGLEGYDSKNRHGEVVKVLLITGAGAEGLNLQNVRQVHIFDPYWNRVRLEQVYGRAIRYCSHAYLPQEEREVKRYLYIATLTDSQREILAKEELFLVDTIADPRDRESLGIHSTTDEMILDLARRKDAISSQFVRLMKEVAFDCAIHQGIGVGTSQVCYSIPKTINLPETQMMDDENLYFRQRRYIVPPDWRLDHDEARDGKMDIEEIVWSPVVVRLPVRGGGDTGGVMKFILRQDTGGLYDYDLGKGNVFEKIGTIAQNSDGDYEAILGDESEIIPREEPVGEPEVEPEVEPEGEPVGES